MHLLVIEDDPQCCELLRQGLTQAGYVVEIATDGPAGLQRALERDFALILLDVMLPGQTGWSVLREIRESKQDVPIFVLTGCATVNERVKGLLMGADDYLAKPFAWEEFMARVRALLRRPRGTHPDIIRVSDVEIDIPRMKATRAGKKLRLTPTEFRLLTALARHHGEVVTRDDLLETIWGVNSLNDTNALGMAINRLRRKVDAPFTLQLIHAVHGRGYTLDVRRGRQKAARASSRTAAD